MAVTCYSRRFPSHSAAMKAVALLEAAGIARDDIVLTESSDAERAGDAESRSGSELSVRVADTVQGQRVAGILDRLSEVIEGVAPDPTARVERTAAGGSSGTVLGHALSGTGTLLDNPGEELPATTAADRDQAKRGSA